MVHPSLGSYEYAILIYFNYSIINKVSPEFNISAKKQQDFIKYVSAVSTAIYCETVMEYAH